MQLEKKLYELVQSINQDNPDPNNYGIHELFGDHNNDEGEEYGFRIYHSDGYCFEILFEKQYDEDDNEIDPSYTFRGDPYEGFKTATIKQALKLIGWKGKV